MRILCLIFCPQVCFSCPLRRKKTPRLLGRREKDGGNTRLGQLNHSWPPARSLGHQRGPFWEPPSAHHRRPQQVKMLGWKYKGKVLVVSFSTHLDQTLSGPLNAALSFRFAIEIK